MSGDPLIPPLSLLLKIQQETRFGEMSKLDIEFKKRQLSIMLCPMQTLRFPNSLSNDSRNSSDINGAKTGIINSNYLKFIESTKND